MTKAQDAKDNNVTPIDGTSTGAMAQAHAEQEGKGKGKAKAKTHDDSKTSEERSDTSLADSIYDQDFLDLLSSSERKLQEIDEKRGELNASKAEVMAKLVAEGLNKDAVKAAIKYFRTPEEKRENFDLSYAITRKALGQPIQDDLFVAAAQRQVDNHVAKKH